MALAYLDTSALVKLCVAEPGTDLVAAVWDGADLVVEVGEVPVLRVGDDAVDRREQARDDLRHEVLRGW